MTTKRNLLWLAVAAASVSSLPLQAAETYNNHVEIGLGSVQDGNGKFGEFAEDYEDDGEFVEGSIHLQTGEAGAITYFDLNKTPYSTRGALGHSRPGNISIEIYTRDSQKVEMDGILLPVDYSVFDPDLPEGGMDYAPDKFKVERSATGIAISKSLGSNWSLGLDYSSEHKDGSKTTAGPDHGPVVGRNVDYQHDQFSAGLEYAEGNLALGASYYVSDFEDGDGSFDFVFDSDEIDDGTIASEPDNQFERVEVDGSYRLGDRTALNWLANWSTAEQNDNVIGADEENPFDIDGEVERFNGRVTLTSRPSRSFNYKLEYSQNDHSTEHDPIDLDERTTEGYRRNSSVYDKDKETIKAEGGYRFANRSKLRFGWKQIDIERTRVSLEDEDGGAELVKWVDETEEDVLWASYRFAPIGNLNLSARYEHSDRDGNQGQNPDWITPYNADRKSDSYSVNAVYAFSDAVVLSAGYRASEEDYGDAWEPAQVPGEYMGMESRESELFNVDLSYAPSGDFSSSIYFMRQTFEQEQFASRDYARRDPRDDDEYSYYVDDEVDVYGVNVDWQASDSIHVAADLTVSDNDSELRTAGIATDYLDRDKTPAGPAYAYDETLPGYGTDAVRLNVKATWQQTDQTAWYLRYIYEDWEVTDLTYDGNIFEDDIKYGWETPDESASAVVVGVRYSF